MCPLVGLSTRAFCDSRWGFDKLGLGGEFLPPFVNSHPNPPWSKWGFDKRGLGGVTVGR